MLTKITKGLDESKAKWENHKSANDGVELELLNVTNGLVIGKTGRRLKTPKW